MYERFEMERYSGKCTVMRDHCARGQPMEPVTEPVSKLVGNWLSALEDGMSCKKAEHHLKDTHVHSLVAIQPIK
jgi:hypothetical protein